MAQQSQIKNLFFKRIKLKLIGIAVDVLFLSLGALLYLIYSNQIIPDFIFISGIILLFIIWLATIWYFAGKSSNALIEYSKRVGALAKDTESKNTTLWGKNRVAVNPVLRIFLESGFILTTAVTQILLLMLLYVEVFRSNVFLVEGYTCQDTIFFVKNFDVGFIFDKFCSLHNFLYWSFIGSTVLFLMFASHFLFIKNTSVKLAKIFGYTIVVAFILSVLGIVAVEFLK